MKSEVLQNTAKRTLAKVIILFVLILLVLPFWTTFQDLLTQLIMKIEVYKSLQNIIVPYELKVTGTILSIAGMPIRVGNAYIEWTKSSGGNEVIYLAWSCVGWQTLVLFVITLNYVKRGDFNNRYFGNLPNQYISFSFGSCCLFYCRSTFWNYFPRLFF